MQKLQSDTHRTGVKHVLLTGATGYVGGQALRSFQDAGLLRKCAVTVLLRSSSHDDAIRQAFPEVRIVHGDLGDVHLMRRESRKADVVFQLASTSHVGAAKAISQGIRSRSRSPGYWIQMSGASMFSTPDIGEGSYGQYRDSVYDDLYDLEEIRAIIGKNPEREVDQIVLAQPSSRVRTALIVGPLIYGTGQGPGNTRSIQLPNMARQILLTGEGFTVGAGKSVWSNIHIHDLGSLFAALLNAAVRSKDGHWCQSGIYIPENGRLSFGDLARSVTGAAYKQGLIPSANSIKEITAKEADRIMSGGATFWGTNAIGISSRAQLNLKWLLKGSSLEEEVASAVRREALSIRDIPVDPEHDAEDIACHALLRLNIRMSS